MRSLFLFLWRHNFFILFFLLEAFCFFLISQNSKYHHASFFNSTNTAVAEVNEFVSSVTEYINLKKTNEALARQNAAMNTLAPNAYYIDSVLKLSVSDTIRRQQYTFMTAKVINNSVNRRNNYLTLNKGRLQGVSPEMGVVSAGGVVGIVKDVSDRFCSVMSVLHKDARISARIKKSGYIGSLVWGGFNFRQATLKDIALHVKLNKGDSIVTSSFSAIFPEGIMIGTVDEIETTPGDNFYTIKVNLSTDYSNLSYVYIVNNLLKEEQQQLEATQKNDR